MNKRFWEWMQRKWVGSEPSLNASYRACFTGNEHGARVLQHLLDSVYCSVYEGRDPIECVIHNARRTVVHEILQNVDIAENPLKYDPQMQEMENGVVRRFA